MYRGFWKRFFDLLFAWVILIAASPILLVVALAVRIDSKGPAVFSQTRLGKNGKEFHMYKFRTMVLDAEKGGG